MPGSQSLSKPQTFNFDLADANLTGYASNVTGASWTLTAHVATDNLAHQISIRNDSANDKSGIAITVVGLDANGNALTESITGPGASATVESAGYYSYVTSVTPASTWGADTADIGWVDEIASTIIPVNHLAEDIVAINADVTGTINYTLQQTFDPVLNTTTVPLWQTIPEAGAQTADNQWNSTGGAQAIRLVVNSYSSGAEIRLNVNPTLISNSSGNGGGGGSSTGDVTIIDPVDAFDHVQVAIYDSAGNALTYNANGQATMANSSPVVIASNQTSIPVAGDVAADAVDSGFPLKVGGKAATALPTAVAAADRVDALLSVLGELVVVPALRGSKGKQTTVITTSTAETTIVTAGAAGVFNDLYGLILSNISATPVTATLKEATSGTTIHIFNVGATSNAGFMLDAGSAIPQTAAAANWTLTCSASITSLEVVALFVARKA